MNIMISINREYMKYACIMLMSLKEHHKDILLSVYILHNELTDEDFQKMDEIIGPEGIELIPVFIPEGAVKDFQIGNWPEVAAYRLLVTDLFAGSLDRILHLDIDLLITGDISGFYHTSFEDYYLAACEDFLTDEQRSRKCRQFGKAENAHFFNTGVLLFNIQKLSADGFYYAVYADIVKKYSNIKIEFPDQDLLNLLFNDKTKYMDKIKYNYAPFFYMIGDREHYLSSQEELEANCHIIHMYGASKPWENINRMAADKLWWEYAARTPFYYDMKMKHVQAMIHKEQKMSEVIESKLQEIRQSPAASQLMEDVEEGLYRILECKFEITDKLAKVL